MKFYLVEMLAVLWFGNDCVGLARQWKFTCDIGAARVTGGITSVNAVSQGIVKAPVFRTLSVHPGPTLEALH